MGPIRIRQAADAGTVAAILQEAAAWLAETGQPLWKEGELDAARIAADVAAGLMFLAERDGTAVATLKFQLSDPIFWPEMTDGDAAYVHRVAVRREYAGQGLSKILLTWAAQHGREVGRRYLRLDCEAARSKLRALYEDFGFRHHSDGHHGGYFVSRYELDLASR